MILLVVLYDGWHTTRLLSVIQAAIIAAPFLDQLGVVESLHTYGPEAFRSSEITNNIIVNVMRIIAGFPSIHDYTMNSDRSVAVGSGLSLNPGESRFYDSFDELRFEHLQRLRNDASCRARELNIIEGKEIAVVITTVIRRTVAFQEINLFQSPRIRKVIWSMLIGHRFFGIA